MTRRKLLMQIGLGSTELLFAAGFAPRPIRAWGGPREIAADLAIIGGGLGGCAAALAALRAGKTVVLTEPTDWVGGQLTSQAVPPDEHGWIERFGANASYRRLRSGIRSYYRNHYPLTDAARADGALNPGNGNVSRLCCEPRAALAALTAMLAPFASSGRLGVLLEHEPIGAERAGDRITSVTVRDRRSGDARVLVAPYILDATELGDLLPLAKVEFVTGFEPAAETGDRGAPDRAEPDDQQSFTCCFAMEHRPGEVHTIDRPTEYESWRSYVPKLRPAWPGRLFGPASDPISLRQRALEFDPTGPGRGFWVYRRIIEPRNFTPGAYSGDGVTLVNWPQNDYWLGNLVGVSADEAARHIARAKQLSLSLLYWLQTEIPRPDGGQGWTGLKLRPDLVGTDDGLAKAPYIRESRRIRAEFTVLEKHVGLDARRKALGRDDVTAEPFGDSIGVGSYRIDLHPSSGGKNYIDVASLPFRIPLGALIPQRVENLLPACKNIGTTHVTNGCYRLHPVEWAIGEAAGALAAFCLDRRISPRAVRNTPKLLDEFQAELKGQGVEIVWPDPLPKP